MLSALNTKIREVQSRTSNRVIHITTPKFNRYTSENFGARLNLAIQQAKITLLILYNRQILMINLKKYIYIFTSNNTKDVVVEKKK